MSMKMEQGKGPAARGRRALCGILAAAALLAPVPAFAQTCYVQKTEGVSASGCQVWSYRTVVQQGAPQVQLPWRRDASWPGLSEGQCQAQAAAHALQSAEAQGGGFRCWEVRVNGSLIGSRP